MYLNNLGSILGRRFEQTGLIDDLCAAVEVNEEAVKSTPHDHPNRVMYLNNLSNALLNRFKRTGSIDDLNAAVETRSDQLHMIIQIERYI